MSELTKQQVARFESDGFLVVPGLATAATLRALREQVAAQLGARPMELEADVGYPGAPETVTAPGGDTPRRLLGAWARGGALAAWAGDPGVLAILGRLLQTSNLLLTQAHHNCVMTKYPSYSSDTHWHQDIRYWSFQPPRLVNSWLALGPERPENGGLRVIPGSHRWHLPSERLDQALFLRLDQAENRAAIETAVDVLLEPGDVLFFDAGVFHAASRNATDTLKLSVVYSYHGPRVQPLPGSKSASVAEIPFALK